MLGADGLPPSFSVTVMGKGCLSFPEAPRTSAWLEELKAAGPSLSTIAVSSVSSTDLRLVPFGWTQEGMARAPSPTEAGASSCRPQLGPNLSGPFLSEPNP